MVDTSEAFFTGLSKRGYVPLLHNVTGTIRWDIGDEGSWLVRVKNGTVSVSRDTGSADSVCACSREDFDRMVVGKQNPTTLFLQGRLKITGNAGLAQKFLRLFPDESLASEQGNEGANNG